MGEIETNEGLHRLRDGTVVRLRPIDPADRDRLIAAFEKLSPRSRYRRFLSPMPRLTEQTLERLVHPDGRDHVAIGAVTVDSAGVEGEGLGVARFFRLPAEPEVAEAALAVIDEKQRLGLGHLLLGAIVDAARERGIRRFRAYVLPGNESVEGLLAEIEPEVSERDEEGYRVYEVELPASSAGELREGAIYRALRVAARGAEFFLRALRG